MSFDRNAKVLDRKWPWPEKGRGQRRRVGGGTKGTSSSSDPHGGAEEKKQNTEKQRAAAKLWKQGNGGDMNLFLA